MMDKRIQRDVTRAAVIVLGAAAMAYAISKIWGRGSYKVSWMSLGLSTRKARFTTAPRAQKGAPQGHLEVLPSEYPMLRRDDIVETLHSVEVPDPYRWLEDPDAPDTVAFVEAQNKLTHKVLEQCKTRGQFKELMTKVYNYARYSCPFKRGDRYYYSHNTGLQPQSVLYSQHSLDAQGQEFLDPNKWSSDGTVALCDYAFSKDGSLLAYSTGSGGSDWREIEMLSIDTATGAPTKLGDKLEYVKFSSMTWTHDHKGFFYNRYRPPCKSEKLGTETDANVDQQLWYHIVGTPQEDDKFIFAQPEHPTWFIGAEVTDDGRYLLLSLSDGCEPANRLYYVDMAQLPRSSKLEALDFTLYDRSAKVGVRPLPLVKLVDSFEAQYEYVANEGSLFTFKTNLHAPRYRLVRTDIDKASTSRSSIEWDNVIPQHPEDLMQWATALKGDVLVVCWLHNVASKLELRSLRSGAVSQEIPLPGKGALRGFSGRREDSEMFFSYSSFTDPGSIFRLDTAQEQPEPELFKETKLNVDCSLSEFVTEQAFVESKDGTKIPMFIVHRAGIQMDGSNPTLMYGYGGFNISLEPGFSPSRLCWMLAYGGIYAVANLRGGGEYGIAWRDAGSVHNKQNVYDDFIACGEYLVQRGYTSPAKLVTQGGSNGGLLVAACANQRPDLFGGVLAQVGVMDMLRFHKFTIGHGWRSDYGDPDKAADFPYLLAYSPIHNVRMPEESPKQYPAMLLTTGDHDDRVVPLHSHKLLATLQHCAACDPAGEQRNPLLSRIEVRAGHGAGKPTEKVIEEAADTYAFAAEVIGASWEMQELNSEPMKASSSQYTEQRML
ncbi:hypothetical protein CVIRNUC_001815 [Coccomyxa viridis]|uniref:Prolyl endopeptidase n=1 Tax=Coccomyxa viridis TaxID=1274662 RepID=A0AAV1HV48_9CHLO|nr:hypothetical protein CVIRNUC_001815 [Coccomyxa viridis]